MDINNISFCFKKLRNITYSQAWWSIPVSPALGGGKCLRPEDHKFEASLSYMVSSRLGWARSYLN
jgi:hypothetical protein